MEASDEATHTVLLDEEANAGECIVPRKRRKPQMTFSAANDVFLLDHILGQQVFHCRFGERETKWRQVAEKMMLSGFNITAEGCKGRYTTLAAAFRKGQSCSLRASGTEEEYSLRDQRLQEIQDLSEGGFVPNERKTQQEIRRSQSEYLINRQWLAGSPTFPASCDDSGNGIADDTSLLSTSSEKQKTKPKKSKTSEDPELQALRQRMLDFSDKQVIL